MPASAADSTSSDDQSVQAYVFAPGSGTMPPAVMLEVGRKLAARVREGGSGTDLEVAVAVLAEFVASNGDSEQRNLALAEFHDLMEGCARAPLGAERNSAATVCVRHFRDVLRVTRPDMRADALDRFAEAYTARPNADDLLGLVGAFVARAVDEDSGDPAERYQLAMAAALGGAGHFQQWGRIEFLATAATAALVASLLAADLGQLVAARAAAWQLAIREHEIMQGACLDAERCAFRIVAWDAGQWLTRVHEPNQRRQVSSVLGMANFYASKHLFNVLDHLRLPAERTAELTALLDEHVEAGVTYTQEALALVGDEPDRHAYLTNAGNALRDRYRRTGDQADLDEAIELHDEAVRLCPAGDINLPHHLEALGNGLAARALITNSSSDAMGMSAAYRRALAVIGGGRHWAGITVADNWSSLAARLGRWDDVVEGGERALDLGTALISGEQQRVGREAWAKQIQDVTGRLAYAHCRRVPSDPRAAIAAIERGRGVLHGARPAAHQPADPVPIVYLATTWSGGLAVLADEHSQDARVIFLPDADLRTVDRRAADLLNALEAERADGLDAVLDAAARWMWTVLAPLVHAAGDPPELRVVATGPFGVLPLHLAWTPDASRPGNRRYLEETTAVRYSLGGRTRVDAAADAPQKGVLVVAEPLPTSLAELPGARWECHRIAALLEHRGEQITSLVGADATVEAVQHAMASSRIVHFACHGQADGEDPMRSLIALANDRALTVGWVADNIVGAWELISLSGCETGRIGTRLLNEFIGMPAALMRAGAANVLATLWRVPDAPTALLTSRFYELWYGTGISPAVALARARFWLRTLPNAELLKRMPELFDGSDLADAELQEQPFATMPSMWGAPILAGA